MKENSFIETKKASETIEYVDFFPGLPLTFAENTGVP